jgi:hypothetical protein
MSYLNLFSFETWNQIFIVFSIAFYLLECYMGYKGIKWLVAIVGFLIGFLLGFLISAGTFTQNAYLPTIIGIAAGVGLAFISFKLYLVGVFIYCGSMAFRVVAYLPFEKDGAQGAIQAVLCIAAFIIVGILAVKFARTCIIAVTAITGSINAVNLMCTPIAVLAENMILKIAVIVLIAVTGILVQRATTK